jgi:hypothetical protein
MINGRPGVQALLAALITALPFGAVNRSAVVLARVGQTTPKHFRMWSLRRRSDREWSRSVVAGPLPVGASVVASTSECGRDAPGQSHRMGYYRVLF